MKTQTKQLLRMPSETNRLVRYTEEVGGTCCYVLWNVDTTMETRYMGVEQRPPWLEAIVNAAVLGGHMQHGGSPPPYKVVWFVVDADRGLICFVDRSKNHVSYE